MHADALTPLRAILTALPRTTMVLVNTTMHWANAVALVMRTRTPTASATTSIHALEQSTHAGCAMVQEPSTIVDALKFLMATALQRQCA